MKKSIAMLLGLALISTISMAMISPAKAALTLGEWRPPYVSKDSSTVVYEDGATASAIVAFTNDIHPEILMNVSKITFEFFAIGINKTLALSSPTQLSHNQYGVFTVSFTADGTQFYSGVRFDFNLIIEWVNATTGPTKVVGSWEYPTWWTGMPWFEVYPVAQADAQDSLAKYYAYYNEYVWYDWHSTLAEQKATQATIEKAMGDTYDERGEYASALTQYNRANTLWDEALTAEFAWRDTREDAELNVTLTEASAMMKEADAAMVTAEATKAQADAAITNAYGWYFIGIGFALGWTLMGVGAIIWAWRRPKPPV